MNTYQIDTLIQLSTVFYLEDGVTPADPTGVKLFVKSPDGAVTEYAYAASQISRTGTGAYSIDLTPNQIGWWTYKWQGTGAIVITSPDTVFNVANSSLITS